MRKEAPSFLDRLVSRVSSAVTIWPVLVPAGVFGVVMSWLAKSVTQINQFGPFGWCFAGLVSFLLFALALVAIGSVWGRWVITSALKRSVLPPDFINPLDKEFRQRRIKLESLAHPLSRKIQSKRFIDCELDGPANIVFSNGGLFNNAGFLDCDIVIHRDDAIVHNCVFLDGCEMMGGKIQRCTIYVSQDMFDTQFKHMMKDMPPVSYERPTI